MLLLLGGLFAMPARGEERFAILIGANVGWANDRPLRYAEADAERMRDVLLELGGFAPDRIHLLRDPDTTTVRARLERLARTLRGLDAESLVVVYYSGHADERHLHLRGPPLSHAELHETLQELPASVRVGILDACKSGSILTAKGGRRVPAFELKVVNELSLRGLVLLTSSGADELSQETRALAGSVFTHHLVSGLRGAADLDRSGSVTLSEAYQYSHQRTEVETAASPVPHRPAFRFDVQGQGDLTLTRLGQDTARLMLPPEEDHRYVVVDEHESRLVAEGRSRPGEQVVLALAPGPYLLKRVLRERMEVARLRLTPGVPVRAETLSYEARPLGAGFLKGGNPEELDADERREWRRGEALRLLALGEAGMALSIFDELLAQRPEDAGALRGRARALVRLAEAYEGVGDRQREREALRAALVAEPSLAEDSDFARWYRRLQELESLEARDSRIRADVESELRHNPRLKRRWGLGVEVLSTRGLLSVSGLVLLQEVWLLHLAVDPLGLAIVGAPSLDIGARRLLPIGGRLTPFVGAGLHLTLAPWPGLWDGDSNFDLRYRYRGLWGNTLHVDAGIQLISSSALAGELGLGVILSEHLPYAPHINISPMLNLGVHWYL
ncbi:caspase family protein [Archangium sp.]|jgi:tetratricopeptide (TPR) repeat protein|uniref:caspase family protein n=1 Tax=Archangium sp. TaxID=1872627 RepID=UPI002EDB488A